MSHRIIRFAPAALTAGLIGFMGVAVGRVFAAGQANRQAKASAVEVGRPAPDFKLRNQEDREVSLADYRGKWVVLYFYPKDFTGGCTLEAHNFQRDIDAYAKANAVILGVSRDRTSSHKDFCAKEGLTFKLLADPGARVSDLYRSTHSIVGYKIAARNTFLIDPEGKVAKIFRGVQPGGHSREVLATLAALQQPAASAVPAP